jgi:hypothetical protein
MKKKRPDEDDEGISNDASRERKGRGTLSPAPTFGTTQRQSSPGGSSTFSTGTASTDRATTSSSTNMLQGVKGIEGSSQDPLGLKVIHRPLQDRRADIIFVHGLGGSSRMTWSKNKDLEFFWPLKFLPLEPDINEARILTFGYNANFRPGSGKNKMSVLDFAKDLLYDLKYAKDESAPELEDLGIGEASMLSLSLT